MDHSADLRRHLKTIADEPNLGRLSVLLSFLQEEAAKVKDLIRHLLAWAVASGLLALATFALPRVLGWRAWITLVSTCLGVLLSVFSLILVIRIYKEISRGPLLAFHFTRFFLLDQQERIISAILASLDLGSPIVLYLRGFKAEGSQAHLVDLDMQIESAVGNDSVIVAINDPFSDLTERITPLAKILVQADLWQGLIEAVIPQACLIIVAAGESTEGLLFEIELLRKHEAGDRAIVILDSNDSGQMPDWVGLPQMPLEDFPHQLRWGTPQLEEELRRWGRRLRRPGDLTKQAVSFQKIVHVHGLSSLLPRLFLYGAMESLQSRDAFARYRRGRLAYAQFDPFSETREAVLDEERESYELGTAIPPLRVMFTELPGKPLDEGFRRWNENQMQKTRLETASWVLGRLSTWRKLQSAIKRSDG